MAGEQEQKQLENNLKKSEADLRNVKEGLKTVQHSYHQSETELKNTKDELKKANDLLKTHKLLSATAHPPSPSVRPKTGPVGASWESGLPAPKGTVIGASFASVVGGSGGGHGGGGDDFGGDDSRRREIRGRSRRDSRDFSPASSRPERNKVNKLLIEASKLIKCPITTGCDIVEWISIQTRTMDKVLQLYGSETPENQCLISSHLLPDHLKTDGDAALIQMRETGFDLEKFWEALFKFSFPAPFSSLEIGFNRLSQTNPRKMTIVEYSRTFRVFCRMLSYSLKRQFSRYIDGLTNSEVRASLKRTNLEKMDYDELVALAMSVSNQLSTDKASQAVSSRLVCETIDEGEEPDAVFKIWDEPLGKYFREADKRGARGRCFNCLSSAHRVGNCKRKKTCLYCSLPNEQARHYSLLCPRAPLRFEGFIEKRDKAVEERKVSVRLASDYDFHFSSSDLEE